MKSDAEGEGEETWKGKSADLVVCRFCSFIRFESAIAPSITYKRVNSPFSFLCEALMSG